MECRVPHASVVVVVVAQLVIWVMASVNLLTSVYFILAQAAPTMRCAFFNYCCWQI
jgi:hypothetical protein